MATAITLALILILIIVMPVFPHSRRWGYVPVSLVAVLIAIAVIVLWI